MSAKRRALGGVCAVLGMASTQALAQSEGADVADVWVCALQAAAYWGSANGTHALSIGTTAANGGNVLLAPTLNLLRHPGWGRAQETYSEDSFSLYTLHTNLRFFLSYSNVTDIEKM